MDEADALAQGYALLFDLTGASPQEHQPWYI